MRRRRERRDGATSCGAGRGALRRGEGGRGARGGAGEAPPPEEAGHGGGWLEWCGLIGRSLERERRGGERKGVE